MLSAVQPSKIQFFDYDVILILKGCFVAYLMTLKRRKSSQDNLSATDQPINKDDKLGFTWIPAYQEIASALLAYENRQSELIKMIRELSRKGCP